MFACGPIEGQIGWSKYGSVYKKCQILSINLWKYCNSTDKLKTN